jgi:hypothetical protein
MTTTAISLTDQPQTYRVNLINAISTRGRVHSDFDTAGEAFAYARENRAYFNNTRVLVRKVVGSVTRNEIHYPDWRSPGRYEDITRQLVATLEINDLTTADDLENLA